MKINLVFFNIFLILSIFFMHSCLSDRNFTKLNDEMFINSYSDIRISFSDSILLIDKTYYDFSQKHLKIIKLLNQYDPQDQFDLILWQQKTENPDFFLGVDLIYMFEGNIDTYLKEQITEKNLKGRFYLDHNFILTRDLKGLSIFKYSALLLNQENKVIAYGDPVKDKFTLKIFQSKIKSNK